LLGEFEHALGHDCRVRVLALAVQRLELLVERIKIVGLRRRRTARRQCRNRRQQDRPEPSAHGFPRNSQQQ
jgi:hypothetical protein